MKFILLFLGRFNRNRSAVVSRFHFRMKTIVSAVDENNPV